jgi:hypothetical protein
MSTLATIGPDPPRLLMLPFAVLLLAVALAPVILRHHWERHSYNICSALVTQEQRRADWQQELLLSIFYVLDSFNSKRSIDLDAESLVEKWRVFGKRNLVFMFILLVALIALPSPARELVMIVTAIVSYVFSPRHVHQANAFTFLPLQEVAALFLGIFGTIIPVLDFVKLRASDLGVQTDVQFFWATGLFSALLDNAPAYTNIPRWRARSAWTRYEKCEPRRRVCRATRSLPHRYFVRRNILRRAHLYR